MMKQYKWIIGASDSDKAVSLASQTGLSSLAAKLAVSRGITTSQALQMNTSTSIDALHDPFLFEGMERAVETIRTAVENGDTIAVYGDYDVDGITATCLLAGYLKSIGASCIYHIPDRLNEGYGINTGALDDLALQNTKLLITVDTGITAVDEIRYANALGMKVIVTDHHECKNTLPDAIAVINPKQPDCGYPFKELAGVGVAFKLVCALHGNTPEMLAKYADLVALGTVADVMPLGGENRAIVNYGIEILPQTENIGLSALLFRSGLTGKDKKKPTSSSISFLLAPKINAAGRFATADLAVELFLTDDLVRADDLAVQLAQMNTDRQKIEADMMSEAMEKLADFDIEQHRGIVLWHENWHHGVIGIVASKLADKYFCPVILISVDDHVGKGSGRSIKGFNLFDALCDGQEHLLKFGGHELAAGLSVAEEDLEAFRDYFVARADETLAPSDCIPRLEVDCEAMPHEFTIRSVSELSIFEPYGMGNQQPRFMLRDMQLVSVASIGNDKHLKFTLVRDGAALDAIWFGVSIFDFPYTEGDMVDAVFSAEINTFRMKTVQLVIKDMRFAASENEYDEANEALYADFTSGKSLSQATLGAIRPTREELVAIWRYLQKKSSCGVIKDTFCSLYRRIRYESRRGISYCKLRIALDIFAEFSLLYMKAEEPAVEITLLKTTGKADLSTSEILKRLTP